MTANFASGTVWTGDNLDIMRGMNSECVDLIYLDPPFNSNRHYEAPIGSKAAGAAFKDAWTLDDVDVCEHGELADRNPAAYSVIEAARQAHGKGMQSYLIFMAVRLLEMRRILKPTGSIYLHCDPTASHSLKLLMDGVFGMLNARSCIAWKRSSVHSDTKQHGRIQDNILYYTIGVPSIYSIVPPNDGSALRHGHHFEPVDFVIDHGRGHHDAYSAGSCQRTYARACGCRQRPRRHREELIESERGWSGREAFVTMMQTADLGQGNDRSGPGRLNGSSIRCVLAERQVGP